MEINKTIISSEHCERYSKNLIKITNDLELKFFEKFENDVSKNTLGTFAIDLLQYFVRYNSCSIQDRALQTKSLFYWSKLAKAFYHLAYHVGIQVSVSFRDAPVKHMGVPYRSYMGFEYWLNTYSVFRVLRDQQGLNILEQITDDAMNRSNGTWRILHKNMLSFLCNLNEEPRKREAYLIAAIKSTHPDSGEYLQEPLAVEYVTYLYEPLLFVYEALLRKNEEDFNTQLIEALTRHKTYYDTKKDNRCDDYKGWVSWRLLGVTALAYDMGLKINVKSDYIPEWLYKGEFKNAKLL